MSNAQKRVRRRASGDTSDSEESVARKQRNRMSAKKFRDKKLQATDELQKKNEELELKNKELAEEKKKLEESVNYYITFIKKHLTSGCQLPDDVKDLLDSQGIPKESMKCDVSDAESTYSLHDESYNHDSKVNNPTGLFSGVNLNSRETGTTTFQNQNSLPQYIPVGYLVKGPISPSQIVPNNDGSSVSRRVSERSRFESPKVPKEYLDAALAEPGIEDTEMTVNSSPENGQRASDPVTTMAKQNLQTSNNQFRTENQFSISTSNNTTLVRFNSSINRPPSQPPADMSFTADLLAPVLSQISQQELELAPILKEQLKRVQKQPEMSNPDIEAVIHQTQKQKSKSPVVTNSKFQGYFQPTLPPRTTEPQQVNQGSQSGTFAQARAFTRLLSNSGSNSLQHNPAYDSSKAAGGLLHSNSTEKESSIPPAYAQSFESNPSNNSWDSLLAQPSQLMMETQEMSHINSSQYPMVVSLPEAMTHHQPQLQIMQSQQIYSEPQMMLSTQPHGMSSQSPVTVSQDQQVVGQTYTYIGEQNQVFQIEQEGNNYIVIQNPTDDTVPISDNQYVHESQIPTTVFNVTETERLDIEQSNSPQQRNEGGSFNARMQVNDLHQLLINLKN